jgi:methionyl-tRNA synthetase
LFEKRSSYQFYDESRKIFLPDRFVKGSCAYCSAADQYGDQCENCGKLLDTETLLNPTSAVSGTPASIRETSHWFLDLTRCEKEVSTWLENAYLRETTRSYVRGLISTGLVKRSMTRDLDWGVPVPLSDPEAQNKVLYVWFDAPIGYISNTKELCESSNGKAEQYTEWWKNPDCDIVHFIGEDNTVFHCVIWIAMLKAEGTFRLPRSVVVNQFINVQFPGKEPEKMSKSRGTAVWIKDTLAQGIGPDSLRYYLTCIAPERARAVYKPDDLVQRHNSELANTLGNFVHRIVSFTLKYCGPKVPNYNQGLLNETDLKFQADLKAAFNETTEFLEACYCRSALDRIMEFCRVCNRYVDSQAPWTTRKSYMPRTEATLALALNAIKFLSVTLSPFIPESAQKIQKILNLDTAKLCWQDAVQPLAGGAALNEPQILFAKIEGQPKTA